MKILKINGDRAVVSAGSVKRTAAINFLSNPTVGDYVMIHAGFAIEKIDPKKAEKTLRIIGDIK